MNSLNSIVLDCDKILEEATGRWHGILARFGIDVGDGRHRPCPLCGGKDRFRFDDKDGRGTWICGQCGSSDGIGMMQKKLQLDFKAACMEVAKVMGSVMPHAIPEENKASPERLREMFKASSSIKAGGPVAEYLRNRGLTDLPPTLRYAPKCYEYETKQDQEAMLAIFSLADGEAVTIHRTFIKDGLKLDIQAPRKCMPPLKKMAGGAVRLYKEEAYTLGVAEGIETAIACHEMFEIPVWACLSANLMEQFQPPVWAKRVEIFGDNDKSYTGQKAAYTLANRLVVKEKIPAVVAISQGADFLEDLINLRTASEK